MDRGVYSLPTVPHLQILLRRQYNTDSVTNSADIHEKLVNSQLIKKFPAQYPRTAKT